MQKLVFCLDKYLLYKKIWWRNKYSIFSILNPAGNIDVSKISFANILRWKFSKIEIAVESEELGSAVDVVEDFAEIGVVRIAFALAGDVRFREKCFVFVIQGFNSDRPGLDVFMPDDGVLCDPTVFKTRAKCLFADFFLWFQNLNYGKFLEI